MKNLALRERKNLKQQEKENFNRKLEVNSENLTSSFLDLKCIILNKCGRIY